MMKNNAVYLLNILDAIDQIEEYTSDLKKDDFLNNRLVQDAVVRNFEIIGEATKNLSPSFRKKYAKMPWKNMSGMRDKLIHNYMGVDWDIIWATVTDVLPDIKNKITVILDEV